MLLPSQLIKKKRSGEVLTKEEIKTFVTSYVQGDLPDYQMSAFLMAVYFLGMTDDETAALVDVMLHSGDVIDLSKIPGFKVDKHSTGGVGDKTSLILGPIVAACGVSVPMISGRGLGHTGGTLDKLESIPGFNIRLSVPEFVERIRDHQICFIGQTEQICPADRKMYALRDVTATVESLPLICASIMSKKLAEGANGIVLDVKYGSGAFMRTSAQAEELAKRLVSIAKAYGKKSSALITNMNQPTGRFAGNALEVWECLDILQNKKSFESSVLKSSGSSRDLYEDTRELSLWLSAYMLWLAGKSESPEAAYKLAESTLVSGKAFEKFKKLCEIHSGDLSKLPLPKHHVVITSTGGYVEKMDCEQLGYIAVKIKAGRKQTTDTIAPTAGVEFHAKVGDFVAEGEPLCTLHGDDLALLQRVSSEVLQHFQFSRHIVARSRLILKIID